MCCNWLTTRITNISRSLVVITAAAMMTVSGGLQPATAADLYNGDYKPRAGSPYDDPRYAELYGAERPSRTHHARRYPQARDQNDTFDVDQHGNRVRGREYSSHYPRRSLKDDPNWRRPTPRRENWRADRNFRLGDHCVPRPVVMRRLQRDGWFSFADIEFRGAQALVTADNDNGGRYRLVVDRCSGEIIQASRIDYQHTRWQRDIRRGSVAAPLPAVKPVGSLHAAMRATMPAPTLGPMLEM